MSLENERHIITKTTGLTLVINAFLGVGKLVIGLISRSTALVSDSINSFSDVFTNFFVLITGRMSRKETDDKHPYGHERFDSLVSVLIGIILIITAIEIAKSAGILLWDYLFNDIPISTPHWMALVVAASTILIKEILYQLTRRRGKKAASPTLMAMALDHRSDELASFSVLVAIGGSLLGWAFLEPIASIIIAFFIIRLGFRIIQTGFSQVVDQAIDQDTIRNIREIVLSFPEVLGIDLLKTRQFGLKYYVDLEICLDADMTLFDAHEVATRIHDEIEGKIPLVKHCMIHVNPQEKR
ncbi:MAG: cation diffusion facilitator family transporter [Candidatus Izemoplasmatales bacterium]|jgi:cation diffusion facilitator family transporter|nr:cation diffusion facilitator family transporter [Candidatus Izemoplasmatales bacterium]